jgi:predicted metal-dependent hydrolase
VRRARRYILRVRPDGTLRITVPRGGSRAEALRFAEQHRRWIERERTRVSTEHTPVTWNAGTTILLRGVEQIITAGADGATATYSDRTVKLMIFRFVPPSVDPRALARLGCAAAVRCGG